MTKLAVVVLLLAACKSEEDYKKQKPPEPEVVTPAEKKPLPPPKKELKPEDMGKCTLKLSGAMTKEQVSLGGRPATNVSYWYGPAEQNNMQSMNGFMVACNGPDIKFQIVPGGGKPDSMPFSPKKYEFKNGKGTDAGVNITLGPTLTFGDPSGYVNVTAFDKHHIAGTIDLSGKLKGKGASGNVKLTGDFDFVCPGFSGCEQ